MIRRYELTTVLTVGIIIMLSILSTNVHAWKNGQDGNASTDKPSECSNPPYSTHDWIADQALSLMPSDYWLNNHKTMYLLGTEAPDNSQIPTECNTPHTGYNDRGSGHSVEWDETCNCMIVDRAAARAKEEHIKALSAYRAGNTSHAAFYLGAMVHYIGDVIAYPHTYPDEEHHSPYEGWVGRRTKAIDSSVFTGYIKSNKLINRKPYTAVKRISKTIVWGKGNILTAVEMDNMYKHKKDNQVYLDSIGESLNYGVNEIADILYRFDNKIK